MTAATDRITMRSQADLIIEDWGTACTVVRSTKTINSQGQFDKSDVTLSTDEKLWIQPAAGNSEVIQSQLNDKTTHLAFQKYSGLGLKANDRITPTGGEAYDVINHFVYETHRVTELQLVVKQ